MCLCNYCTGNSPLSGKRFHLGCALKGRCFMEILVSICLDLDLLGIKSCS